MAFNKDINSLFDKYVNQILEAGVVRPVEVDDNGEMSKKLAQRRANPLEGLPIQPGATNNELEAYFIDDEDTKPATNPAPATKSAPAAASSTLSPDDLWSQFTAAATKPATKPAPAAKPAASPAPAPTPGTTTSAAPKAPVATTGATPGATAGSAEFDAFLKNNPQYATTSQTNTPLKIGTAENGIEIGNPNAKSTSNVGVSIPKDLQFNPNTTAPAAAPATVTDVAGGANTGSSSNTGGGGYSGGSIVDYLKSTGQASDMTSRKALAAKYGINNYSGTAEQNTQLLGMLRGGQKPAPASAAMPMAGNRPGDIKSQPLGGVTGGISKAAGTAGNVVKNAVIGDRPLGGILGGVSKGLGSIGNFAKNTLVGSGKPAAPAQTSTTTAPQATQTQTTSTKAKKSPTYQKIR